MSLHFLAIPALNEQREENTLNAGMGGRADTHRPTAPQPAALLARR